MCECCDMTTGAELRQSRKALGITQQALADAIGVHRLTVVGWEQRAEVPRRIADRYIAGLNRLRQE